MKLSTTVAVETVEFLEKKVKAGEARSLAEALDQVVGSIRRLENRRRLAQATARYFAELDGKARAEEEALGRALSDVTGRIDFQNEL
jgi:hypothetical protein